MVNLIEFLSQPWPWFVAGPLLASVMFLLLYFGNSFGVSSNFRTICAIGGAGNKVSFFRFNWKDQMWNLVFVFGAAFGGILASKFLVLDTAVGISEATQNELSSFGIVNPGNHYIPTEIFNWENLLSVQGLIMIVLGGFLVGFGARYAGGCTSGHAISGLSNLQISSLLAVVGFFIGGLLITNFVMPFLLAL